MLIEISAITVDPGRRTALPEDIQKMAKSIAKVGLLNPITIDKRHTLIAGLHRLEAAKLLEWTEIECIVSDLDDLQSELAEIDENFVRRDLSMSERRELLLRRKEIYEKMWPETKATYEGGAFRGNQHQDAVAARSAATTNHDSFVRDTSKQWGRSERAIREDLQMARNLSPEAKEIIDNAENKITKKSALKLSHLEPEQQKEAATLLASGSIRSVEEYTATPSEAGPDTPPFHIGGRQFSTFAEGVADLKNTEKDFRCTPDDFLAEVTAFAQKFHREIEWYSTPYYEEVYLALSPEQLVYLRRQTDSISAAAEQLYRNIANRRATI